MRTHVDLFSGIGGFSLACEWVGVKTTAFAETNKYATKVLQKRWPGIPNYGDVRAVPALSAWLLTGGVPCQPVSSAGRRKGTADDRWLWPQALEVAERGSYQWLLFENPTGILSLNDGMEFENICLALEDKDYEVQPIIIPALAVEAPHRRDRVWIMAYSKHVRWSPDEVPESIGTRTDPSQGTKRAEQFTGSGSGEGGTTDLAHTVRERLYGSGETGMSRWNEPTNSSWWLIEPSMDRVVDGVPGRVDRIRCLGNAIVPQVAYQLIKRMIESESVWTSKNEKS